MEMFGIMMYNTIKLKEEAAIMIVKKMDKFNMVCRT